MAGPSSPNETSSDCLVTSFHRGYLRQISNQVAGIKQGQENIRATQDLHLVLTGQVLEAIRSMGKPTAPPPSGHMKTLSKLRAWASDVLLLHKLFVAWRAVSIPTAVYTLARWAGLL